ETVPRLDQDGSAAAASTRHPDRDLPSRPPGRGIASAYSGLRRGDRAAGASGRTAGGGARSGTGDEGEPRAARAAPRLYSQRSVGPPDGASRIGAAWGRSAAAERDLIRPRAVPSCEMT